MQKHNDGADADGEAKPVRAVAPDKPAGSTGRAAVYVPVLTSRPGHQDEKTHAPEARLAEALGLAAAIELEVIASGLVPLRAISPSTLIGSGRVAEIKQTVADEHIELVIIDYPLSPVQQRNLEKALGAKVVDRTGLILEIFGRRARTAEGKLQVELANLTYAKSRLVRAWTHLERQRGGAGFLGGPGETQKELDKRMLQDTIDSIKLDLEKVKRTRALHRKGRTQVPYPVVALVGYTNAGKSTLFNTLTGAGVFAKDLLFATLDPTMREVKLASGRRIILADTVGFISQLPTTLIAAFRATLEEVLEAHVILHVRDIASPESEAQRVDVLRVLSELGIAVEGPDSHIVEVWNKADLLAPERLAELQLKSQREAAGAHVVSALTGAGVPELLAAIDAGIGKADELVTISISPSEGALMAWLHQNAEVLGHEADEDGRLRYRLRIDKTRAGRLKARLAEVGEAGARVV